MKNLCDKILQHKTTITSPAGFYYPAKRNPCGVLAQGGANRVRM